MWDFLINNIKIVSSIVKRWFGLDCVAYLTRAGDSVPANPVFSVQSRTISSILNQTSAKWEKIFVQEVWKRIEKRIQLRVAKIFLSNCGSQFTF